MDEFSFSQTLQDESKLWEADGLLSDQQREAILQRYKNQQQDLAIRKFPLYIRVVLILAILLIGLAVLILIGFNWKFLSSMAKLSIVGGVLAVLHASGLLLRFNGKKVSAEVAFFLAGIMFGVGIWQVGQVFHLPANFSMGLLLWAIGTFLMTIVLSSTQLHLLSSALLAAWVLADLTGSLRFPPDLMHLYNHVPFFALLLPVFAILGIGCGLQQKKPVAAYAYVLVLLFWWILQGIGCEYQCLPFHIAVAGLICLAISALLKTCRFTDIVLGRLGIYLILGGLFVPSFLFYWNGLFRHWNRYGADNFHCREQFQNLTLLAIDYLVLLILFWFNKRKEDLLLNNKFVGVLTGSIFVLWLGSYLVSLHTLYFSPRSHIFNPLGYNLKDDPLTFLGMFSVNVLLVLTSIWLIQIGFKRGRGDWFWCGVLFFLFWTIVRYVDLFSGFGGMLGAAGMFLFCGLLLFGISYLWVIQVRKRAAENIVEVFETPSQPFPFPLWLKRAGNTLSQFWQSERNVLTASVLVVLIQFSILGAMIANEMVPHLSGTTIYVTTVPVDLRDMFRGDYVVLRYPFSDLAAIPNGAAFQMNRLEEQTVFVSMQQDGELWKPTGISKDRPKDGVFLRGIVSYQKGVTYGIESYFVQEGTGKEIERARQRGDKSVVVELTVAPSGKASIKTVRVKEEPPAPAGVE